MTTILTAAGLWFGWSVIVIAVCVATFRIARRRPRPPRVLFTGGR